VVVGLTKTFNWFFLSDTKKLLRGLFYWSNRLTCNK
jgi:hypothetical protein